MLLKLAEPEALHRQYASADPFPHIVIDGLFDYTAGRPEDERSAPHDTIFKEPA